MPNSLAASKTRSFRTVIDALMRSWWIVVIPALVCGCLALGASVMQTPVYRSSAVLYVTSGSDPNALSAYQGSLASQQRVASYVRLVRSDAVIASALRSSGLSLSVSDARNAVSAIGTPETVLLTVSADSEDQYAATALANAVASSLSEYVTSLEKPSSGGQSLAKVTVVTPASPEGVVAPLTGRNVLVGLILGAFVGLLASAVRIRLDNKIRDESDVEAVSGANVLAVVPSDDSLSNGGTLDLAQGAGRASEAYRRLRTNLEFASVDRPATKLLISSPTEGDGKTTTALNLGAVLAESGHRVVVVGGDLRKPTVADRLGVNPGVGLTDYLRGEVSVMEVVQETSVENLCALASGPVPPNPSELLGSTRARDGFEILSESFDFVLVDSAPILPVSDASVVSKWMDGLILVVRSSKTKRAELESTLSDMAVEQTRVLGVVLNGIEEGDSLGAYSYYGYGFQEQSVEGSSSLSNSGR
ncbi:polysaccharide biosynthesis tyrosine autokinase [Gordonia alkanivorans]|nr:polysaccharide biosynthesis tyrosine autokinase [Gordonia alkanivorans]